MALSTREPPTSPWGRPPDGWHVQVVGGSSTLWWLTIGTVVLALLVPVVVSLVLLQTFYNPPTGELPDPRPGAGSLITRITDANGRLLGTLNRFDTHIPVQPSDVTPVLRDAVIAVEDKRFYSHKGVDLQAVMRALWADLQGGSYEQGASTITQQYVKRIYTGPQRSLARKVREATLASRVEKQLSKDEILFRYLEDIYLGSGAYGVGAAAEAYFRTPVKQLNLSQAATLAGLIQSPSRNEPRSNLAGAEERRQVVLRAMRDQNRISDAQYNEALSQRLRLATDDDTQPSLSATLVYPPERADTEYPYFVDYVRRYLIARYGEDRVYQGGLQVQTTIDARLQGFAEEAVRSTLSGTTPPLEMSLVSLDPTNGYVKALIGGRDFAESQVNLALGNCEGIPKAEEGRPICIDGGGTGRQPGSAFKPYTLAKAFEEGIGPDRVYSGPSSYTFPRCRGEGCTVGNAEGGGFGALPLRQATAHSVNTVFAQLVLDVGVKETAEMANRLGITMVSPDGIIPKGPNKGDPYGPSLTLGAAESSPLDMAAAFGVFARRGEQFPATPVIKVTDPKGTVLEDNSTRRGRRVLPEVVADNVNDVLKGTIAYGTGRAADIGRPDGTAGKTGTSEDYSDAWFVGYTQKLVTSVWMGYANSQRPLLNVKGVAKVFGGTLPAETWKTYMTRALEGVPDLPFPPPGPLPRSKDAPREVAPEVVPDTIYAGPFDTSVEAPPPDDFTQFTVPPITFDPERNRPPVTAPRIRPTVPTTLQQRRPPITSPPTTAFRVRP
ncbi:MAG TPA: transglycosylase domain-containing protein [Acidimicrobiales bacterium]|nr:transglycosylase domain-containing protein [Acidimicrobiales bacterium]